MQPAEIWKEYEKSVGYNTAINLYDNVKLNNEFMSGEQWKNLVAPDLDKPVMNFSKRVVNYTCAMLISNNIGVSISSQSPDESKRAACDILSAEVDKVLEANNIKTQKNREAIRNAAIDGDAGMYFFLDDDGNIKAEIVEATRYLAGNPYERNVQEQPHIIIVKPMMLEDAKRYAKAKGVKKSDIDIITPDNPQYEEDIYGADRVTVLIRFWKSESKRVHFCICTRDVVIQPDTDTGYALYPFATFIWEPVRNSYHGLSLVTEIRPNQLAANKLWAMVLRQEHTAAFPKLFYDCRKLPQGWNNRVGEAIAVSGNPQEAIFGGFRPPDMSAQVMQVLTALIEGTKECMGASDAALGNIRPENTSAIIAVQKATAAPLDMQRQAFYQFVDDCIRIIIEIIHKDYGPRLVWAELPSTDPTAPSQSAEILYDFGAIDLSHYDIAVDVGASAYWSELLQVSTNDALFKAGVIPDALTYVEGIPDEYLRNKNEIIKIIKEQTENKGGTQNAVMPAMQAGSPNFQQ